MAAKPRDYEQYLLSSHWRRFRHLTLVRLLFTESKSPVLAAMLKKRGRTCIDELIHGDVPLEFFSLPCRDCKGDFRPSEINLHHLNYDCLGREKLIDVVVLCQKCHKNRHGIRE